MPGAFFALTFFSPFADTPELDLPFSVVVRRTARYDPSFRLWVSAALVPICIRQQRLIPLT